MYKFILTLIISCLLLITGCQQTTQKNTVDRDTTNLTREISVENDFSSNETLANHLAEIAANVPKVTEATALIAGPYAVVGIDIDENLDRSTVGIIKYSVAEALRNDSYGKTAVVIADGDIRQRLRNMQDSIANGRPIQGVIDELAAIVGRYIPSLPPTENRLINDEQQENIITNEEQNELENIQKEQSTE